MASAALRKIVEQNVGVSAYCASEKNQAVLRFKADALGEPYLQLNSPYFYSTIICDVDRRGAAESWEDAMLPPPTFVAITKDNGHAHLGWALNAPVCRTDAARLKPLQFLASVQWAMNKKVNGDLSFVGPLSKNPLHPKWEIWEPANAPTYELNYLAEYLELPKFRPRRVPGIGRNCDLFEDLARWAYRAIRSCWGPGKQELWYSIVLNQAEEFNTFEEPLAYSEYKSIARSVARYTWRNFTPEGFRKSQASVGRLGGVASGVARRAQTADLRIQAESMFINGTPQNLIADVLKVDKSTISRWLQALTNRQRVLH